MDGDGPAGGSSSVPPLAGKGAPSLTTNARLRPCAVRGGSEGSPPARGAPDSSRRALPQDGREVRERLPRFGLLLTGQADPAVGEVGPRLGRDLEGVRRRALGGQLEEPRAVRVEPQLDDDPPRQLGGVKRSFRTKIGPRTERSSSATPSGAWAAYSVRCSLEKSRRRGRPPARVLRTIGFSTSTFSRPEQTKPPGMALTSTPNPGWRRSAAGSSSGTTGRSFTTASSPLPWMRRVRTTSPCALSASSGVSKKNTWRIWASSGSSPSAATVERWSDSGTVSFSSTLSEPRISAMRLTRSSSEKPLGVVDAVVITFLSAPRPRRWPNSLKGPAGCCARSSRRDVGERAARADRPLRVEHRRRGAAPPPGPLADLDGQRAAPRRGPGRRATRVR